jgi:DNA-directed RNA polymerase specialized sigma24 family protein
MASLHSASPLSKSPASIASEMPLSKVRIAGLYSRWTSDEPSHGWLSPEPCDDDAQRAVQALAALSPRHRELVLAMEADETEIDNDETQAAAWSRILFIDKADEAAWHLEWLRATARNLVIEQWPRIARLAAVLEERIVLSGDEAVANLAPYIAPLRRDPQGDSHAQS